MTEHERGTSTPRRSAGRLRHAVAALIAIVGAYLIVAYIVLPALWSHYEHQPGLAAKPMVTRTAQDIPGDAMNVGLVGTKEEVIRAMLVAGWHPADPITFDSSIGIVDSVLLSRPDPDAPVSTLYYEGRKQDLAFEKPVGESARQRHHVRLWLVLERGLEGRPVWLGAATFDESVGVSHYTGQVTHHIGPDIDAERDLIIFDLTAAHMLTTTYQVSGVGPTWLAFNGGGDRYYTDGEIGFGVIAVGDVPQSAPPVALPNPAVVDFKNQLWSSVTNALSANIGR
jgi:hypothetical protein